MTRQTSDDSGVNVPEWNLDAFAARLKDAIGDTSPYSMEKKTGIAQSLVRKYLAAQSVPGVDKVVAMAKAVGVSVQWLATGKEVPPLGQPQIDYDKLEEVMNKTLRLFQDRGGKAQARSPGPHHPSAL